MPETTARPCFERLLACGPRLVGSPGERAAADFVAERFTAAGLTVSREEFGVSYVPVIVASRIVPLVAVCGLIVAAWLYPRVPWFSALVLLALLAMVLFVRRWHHFGQKLFDVGRQVATANIVGRRTTQGSDRVHLVFLAHYDSKSQTLPLVLRIPLLFVSAGLCAVLLVLATLAVAGPAAPSRLFDLLTALAVVGLVCQVVNRTTNCSPGAMDNASGLTVLVGLAERLAWTLGNRADLTFIATGAEELGLGGALRFMQRHRMELNPARTLCVNFDTVGAGGTVYLAGSTQPFPAVRAKLIAALTRRGLSVKRFPIVIGVGLDHMRLTAAGLWAVSLTQGPLLVASRIHSSADSADKVDPTELDRLTDAFAELAESIVTRPSS